MGEVVVFQVGADGGAQAVLRALVGRPVAGKHAVLQVHVLQLGEAAVNAQPLAGLDDGDAEGGGMLRGGPQRLEHHLLGGQVQLVLHAKAGRQLGVAQAAHGIGAAGPGLGVAGRGLDPRGLGGQPVQVAVLTPSVVEERGEFQAHGARLQLADQQRGIEVVLRHGSQQGGKALGPRDSR